MQAPRIAARIAGSFILRVIALFATVIATIAASVGVEYLIAITPGVSPEVAHYLQLGLLIAAVAVVMWASWLFGSVFARPLATVIAWVGNLSRGRLDPPREPDGRPKWLDARGAWRPGYRTFHEVFEALEALTEQLRETERQRAEMRAMREEWIAGVSHDLKTPLASVRGYAQLLASDEEPPEEVHRQATAILEQAHNMESLLDDLRLTTRLRAQALPMDIARVDASELVRGAVLSVMHDPASAGHEFELIAPDIPVMVDVDANLLGRAVRNLVTNAVVHNPAGTHVSAVVEPSDDAVRISVADDGVGMDDETQRMLFERYYRGTSTTIDVSHTGLGMAIARQLVEAHGGSVEVRSVLDKGTTITIVLPVSSSAVESGIAD